MECLLSQRAQNILGDKFVFVVNAAQLNSSGAVTSWVGCKKHKTYAMVKMADNLCPTDAEIMAAAQSCLQCIQEQAAKLPPTRWPNAGEPGGAEL